MRFYVLEDVKINKKIKNEAGEEEIKEITRKRILANCDTFRQAKQRRKYLRRGIIRVSAINVKSGTLNFPELYEGTLIMRPEPVKVKQIWADVTPEYWKSGGITYKPVTVMSEE